MAPFSTVEVLEVLQIWWLHLYLWWNSYLFFDDNESGNDALEPRRADSSSIWDTFFFIAFAIE